MVSSDGRYATWLRVRPPGAAPLAYDLAARDVVTGEMSYLPLTGQPAEWLFHPRSSRIFLRFADRIERMDASDVRTLTPCTPISDMSLTLDGNQLFVACSSNTFPSSGSVAIVDTETLTVMRSIDSVPTARRIEANKDGSRFATFAFVSGEITPRLVLQDSVSGAIIASAIVASVGTTDSLLKANADRSKLVASTTITTRIAGGSWYIYDFANLELLGQIAAGAISLAASSDGAFLIGIGAGRVRPPAQAASVLVIDPQSFSLQFINVGYSQSGARVAIASAPLSPIELDATVVARQFTLKWKLPVHSFNARSYRIEARLSPSGAIVASIDTNDAQYSTAAPAGVYYVTVRASNDLGSSGPSAQIQVVVP